MQIRVLGPLDVISSRGSPLEVRGARRRLLLATLVLHRNSGRTTEQLVDVLFGEEPPARAAGTVQSYVSRLRQDLGDDGDRLQTRPGGYVLALRDDEVDSARFEGVVRDASKALPTDPVRTADLLAKGLSWWRGGGAYSEFGDDLGIRAEKARLGELRQRGAAGLVDAHLALGNHPSAIDLLETFIADWPLREEFRAQRMLALYRWGRQPEALRAFQQFRTDLGDDLGLEPSPMLTDLEARMLRQDPTLDCPAPQHSATTAAATPDHERPARGNLPLSINALLGREGEVAQLLELLGTVRLLTLTGPGGVGKTRLALRLGERSAPGCPDGVWMCDLGTIREGALAAEAITTALDVQRRHDRSTLDGLVEVLRTRELLVILDNCEHVLMPVAEVTEAVLRSCPDVRILTTSREPLGIDGETVWPLGPLPLPEAGEKDPVMAMESPAVRLFVARATSGDPSFRLGEDTVAPVSELCRRLDGLPLALELAAARVRSIAPGELAERLDQRFTILTASARHSTRHQTLHATVAWSYGLLGVAEQALFDRLSVFAASFTAADAERVCADGTVARDAVAHVLAALVDKSMVVADTSRSPTHYRLLETLRAFGREEQDRTGGTERLQRRHAAWAVEHVERGQAGLDGPEESAWSTRLDVSFDDVRTAHRFALARGDVDGAMRLVAGGREFAFRQMRYELFGWAEATSSFPGADAHPLAPLVLATAAYGRFVRGDLDGALDMAERSLELEREHGGRSCGLHHRTSANIFYYRGQAARAAATCQRMIAAARASGDDATLVHALYMSAVGLTSAGQAQEGRRLADEAIAVARRTGNPTALATALYALALTIEPLDPEQSASMLEDAVAHGAAADNRWIVAFAKTELISLASRRGDLDAALGMAGEVIEMWHRAGDWANQWLTLRHVAGVFAQRGDHGDAAVLHAAVKVASADLAMPIEASDLRRVGAILDQLPDALGRSAFEDATARGAAMSAETVVHTTQAVIERALFG